MKPILFSLLAFPVMLNAAANPQELLQATRPDVVLRFRYCVPTTAEVEMINVVESAAESMLIGELIKRIPAGPERSAIEAELRASEAQFRHSIHAAFEEFVSVLEPEDRIYRYAFEYYGRQEAGLVVVRGNEILQKFSPRNLAVFPHLVAASPEVSGPVNALELLYALEPLIKASGIIRLGDELLLVAGGKAFRPGSLLPVTFHQRQWTPLLADVQERTYVLHLDGEFATFTLGEKRPWLGIR
jgi:hypothetical protein